MSRKDLLKQYGLIKNPYTDRTAEKTTLDELSCYMHSDLQGFQPSGTACPSRSASSVAVCTLQRPRLTPVSGAETTVGAVLPAHHLWMFQLAALTAG